jgi:hypothetical protein
MTDQLPQEPQPQAAPAKTSGLAIASFVSSLVFFVPVISGALAVVLGILALIKISDAKGAVGGKRLAIAGIIIGGVFFLMTCVLLPVIALVPAFSKAREQARAVTIRSDLKQIGLAVRTYQLDTGEMPVSLQALVDQKYVQDPQIFSLPSGAAVSPSDVDGSGHFYYFQIAKADGRYPERAAIAWEKAPFAPNGKINVLFVDGDARLVSREELQQAIDQYRDSYVKEPTMPAVSVRASGGDGATN